MERITCSECGTVNNLNPKKHLHRPKWCQGCRAVIANEIQPSVRLLKINRFLSQLPIIKQRIERRKKIKRMRARVIIYENSLKQQEEAARQELAQILKDFPHLQEWAV